jgi:tRNA A-37 threonylcarbamoyl transferase component Bud32
MSETSALLEGLSEDAVWRLEEACCRFERAWQDGRRPRPEDFVAGAEGQERLALLRELVRLDVDYRRRAGEGPCPEEYQRRFPDAGPWLHEVFADTLPVADDRSGLAPAGVAGRWATNPRDTDRNLLFGVLALQADLLDTDRFAKACALWAADKARPLADVLVEQGWLTPEDRADVDKLLRRKLAKHGGDAHASLADAVGRPAAASLAGVMDPDVRASLASAAEPLDPGRTLEPRPVAAGPRFRRLRPHATGGLGEVFVALDLELHREVALKEIKEEHAHQGGSRARFVLEAEITGGLEHPGVVPVYGLGLYADGRPFYAMRFIKGDTLRDAVKRFHASPGDGFDSLAFRQLLGRFVDVCQAVAYAHSRGVLHRDLKPQNIMLGKFGETLVVDWGLAKVVGRGHGVGAEERTLRPALDEGAGTLAGSAVGTPGFMSPEQVAGKVDELGPATDVYSLGATLYVLLTNEAPLKGKVAEVLRRTQEGAWLLPREVNRAVPAALDAVCRRAMALRPGERYASALELTEDLEHWLADEPVSAYRDPVGARLRRWMRKNSRRVMAAGVLLLAAVVVILTLSQVRTTAALAEATTQRGRAERYEYLSRISQADRAYHDSRMAGAREVLRQCKPEQPGWEWHYLNRITHAEQFRASGHLGAVHHLTLPRHGRWMVSGGVDHNVIFWDASTGHELHPVPGHTGPVWGTALSANGQRLATVAGSTAMPGELIVWAITEEPRLEV